MIVPSKYLYGHYATISMQVLKSGGDRAFETMRKRLYDQLCSNIADSVKIHTESEHGIGNKDYVKMSAEVFVLSREQLFELYEDTRKEITHASTI